MFEVSRFSRSEAGIMGHQQKNPTALDNKLTLTQEKSLTAMRLAWSRAAQMCVLLCAICLIACTAIAPLKTLFAMGLGVTAIILTHSILRAAACIWALKARHTAFDNADIEIWPHYTVLIPLIDEAHMIPSIIAAMSRLDYPRERLQILLITETIDPATTYAAQAFAAPPFKTIVVPPGGPKTKPNALNYALQFATGSIITIYDAEDHPHSKQLKIAAKALHANPKWGALQAPLDYYNASESAIARQFAIEYAALFHVWVPFLARLGLPFPLGGTSNHIRRVALAQTRGWDAHNVTEDADLSFRLSYHGWQIGYIPAPTAEEAITRWTPWCDQRTRWMKGYMQTWMVHMQSPLSPGGGRGLAKVFTLQITLGASLLSGLCHALIVAAIIGGLIQSVIMGQFPPIYGPILTATIFSYAVNILIGVIGVVRAGKPSLIWAAPLMPFYWLALIVPSWIALIDLFIRPFHWRKTSHGITHMHPAD